MWHVLVVLKVTVNLLKELQCFYTLICGKLSYKFYCGVYAKHFASLELAGSRRGFNERK